MAEAFAAQQQAKEIHIRKVLGSGVLSIMLLLSRDFTKLVLRACVFGLPMVYYFMNSWLEGFATRVDFGWLLFVACSFVVLAIALVTVSYQTFKAAVVNPSESLKYE